MDNNFKKLLSLLSQQIDVQELQNAVKEDNFEGEFGLSDDALQTAASQLQALLTIEAAKHNKELSEYFAQDLYPKHKKSFMSKIEQDLLPIFEKLGVDTNELNHLSEGIPLLQQKLEEGVLNGKEKDLVESYKQDLRKSLDTVESTKSAYEKQIEELKAQYEARDLKKAYRLKAKDYSWGDAYNDPLIQDAILDKVYDKINSKAYLKLADDGEDIRVFQRDMPEKELYEGNKIQTFQNLLEPEIANYLKKSNPGEPEKKLDVKKSTSNQDLNPKQQAWLNNRDKRLASNR